MENSVGYKFANLCYSHSRSLKTEQKKQIMRNIQNCTHTIHPEFKDNNDDDDDIITSQGGKLWTSSSNSKTMFMSMDEDDLKEEDTKPKSKKNSKDLLNIVYDIPNFISVLDVSSVIAISSTSKSNRFLYRNHIQNLEISSSNFSKYFLPFILKSRKMQAQYQKMKITTNNHSTICSNNNAGHHGFGEAHDNYQALAAQPAMQYNDGSESFHNQKYLFITNSPSPRVSIHSLVSLHLIDLHYSLDEQGFQEIINYILPAVSTLESLNFTNIGNKFSNEQYISFIRSLQTNHSLQRTLKNLTLNKFFRFNRSKNIKITSSKSDYQSKITKNSIESEGMMMQAEMNIKPINQKIYTSSYLDYIVSANSNSKSTEGEDGSKNFINDDPTITYFFNVLSSFSNLKSLRLNENNLGNSGIHTFSQMLLDSSSDDIASSTLMNVNAAVPLFNLPQRTTGEKFVGPSRYTNQGSNRTFQKSSKIILEVLELRGNNISDNSINILSNALLTCASTLKHLDLSWNGIKAKGLDLFMLHYVFEVPYLRNNQLSTRKQYLPDCFEKSNQNSNTSKRYKTSNGHSRMKSDNLLHPTHSSICKNNNIEETTSIPLHGHSQDQTNTIKYKSENLDDDMVSSPRSCSSYQPNIHYNNNDNENRMLIFYPDERKLREEEESKNVEEYESSKFKITNELQNIKYGHRRKNAMMDFELSISPRSYDETKEDKEGCLSPSISRVNSINSIIERGVGAPKRPRRKTNLASINVSSMGTYHQDYKDYRSIDYKAEAKYIETLNDVNTNKNIQDCCSSSLRTRTQVECFGGIYNFNHDSNFDKTSEERYFDRVKISTHDESKVEMKEDYIFEENGFNRDGIDNDIKLTTASRNRTIVQRMNKRKNCKIQMPSYNIMIANNDDRMNVIDDDNNNIPEVHEEYLGQMGERNFYHQLEKSENSWSSNLLSSQKKSAYCKALESLNLANNNIGDNMICLLIEAIPLYLNNLKHLNINATCIGDRVIDTFIANYQRSIENPAESSSNQQIPSFEVFSTIAAENSANSITSCNNNNAETTAGVLRDRFSRSKEILPQPKNNYHKFNLLELVCEEDNEDISEKGLNQLKLIVQKQMMHLAISNS